MEPPKPPGYDVPQRTVNCRLEELVGLSAREVKQKLGSPGSKLNYDRAPRPQDGYFGPGVPMALDPEEPCSCWTYKNIAGSNWVLWMARRAKDGTRPQGALAGIRGEWVVVGVTSYPVGAVF